MARKTRKSRAAYGALKPEALARLALGESTGAVAVRLGVARSTISRWRAAARRATGADAGPAAGTGQDDGTGQANGAGGADGAGTALTPEELTRRARQCRIEGARAADMGAEDLARERFRAARGLLRLADDLRAAAPLMEQDDWQALSPQDAWDRLWAENGVYDPRLFRAWGLGVTHTRAAAKSAAEALPIREAWDLVGEG